MARWSRAVRALTLPPGARVLDLGCAFGFGTRALVARGYETYGHDLNAEYIARARSGVRGATFTLGDATEVPYPDGSFDGIVLLDVLEHVPNDRAVIAEVARVLRPGGQLVVSVPNRGLLSRLDSLNLYHRLLGATAPLPTDDPSWVTSPLHRHYSKADLETLLGPWFGVQRVQWSGLGVAEPVNFLLLLALRAVLKMPRLYNLAQYLYFGVYLLEDLLPTGPYGYHLMVTAERLRTET